MLELADYRTMKGFLGSFFGFRTWCLVFCFTIPRISPVYGNGCLKNNWRLTATIPDAPVQKVNKSLLNITIGPTAQLSLMITDLTLSNALGLLENEGLWKLQLVQRLDLDRGKYTFQRIKLVCKDGPAPGIKIDIMLTFEYYNTYQPRFIGAPYVVPLNETTPINRPVFSLKDKIIDKDFWPLSKNQYEYSLSPSNSVFDIDSGSGEVILREPLDFESNTRKYAFTLFVQDLGDKIQQNRGVKINTTLVFTVLNDDDLSPKFKTRFFHVDIFENVTIHSTCKIEPIPVAIDGDNMNIPIIYELIDKPKDFDNYFKFLKTMEVEVMTRLDQIPRSTFNMRIKAYQSNRPSERYDIGYLVINVHNLNKHIPNMRQTNYLVSVRENTLLPTILMQVKAIDQDGNALEYMMQPPTTGGIHLDKTNGLITLTNYTGPKIREIKFKVYAQESNTALKRKSPYSDVTIKIIDENDHSPVFTQSLYNATIKQNGEVVTVEATDADPALNGEITYELVGSQKKFTIDNKGVIRKKGHNLMRFGKYRFMVIAKDKAKKHSRSASAIVEVNVPKVNLFKPKFPQDMKSKINILESTPNGTNLLNVFATDDDLDSLTYTVKPNDTFGMSSSTKSGCSFLYLKKELDAENDHFYSLEITVSDTKHKASHVLNATVDGVNDNYPTFEHSTYKFSLAENEAMNHGVGFIKATDNDINPTETIKYSLADTSNFEIDPTTGLITSKQKFEILKPTYFTIVAFASDEGSPKKLTASCLVNITILDINNHIPEFSVQSVQLTVLEDKIKDRIYNLEATDKDFDPKYNKISYEIQASKSAFFILKNTNELYLENGKVDQVLGRTVSVIVETFDTNRLAKRNSITITITFKDINNNLPLFGQTYYQKDILENTTVGSPIFTMKVSDDDVSEENKKTEFSIVNWRQNIPFFINANTGVITPWRTLYADGTESPTFSFKVRAQNTRKMEHLKGKDFTEVPVNITILDINNHIPEFSAQSVQLTVLEDKMRDLIYLLKATDKDFDPKYNKISYEIQGSKSAFFILKNTNELYMKNGKVDQVLGRTVSVIVEAFDTNRPAKRNSIKITITFKDINNNLPLFGQAHYQKDILENTTIGSPIFTMTVSDDDVSEENKKTEFSIVNWSQKIPFFINANTGVITPWRTLDADGTESTTFSFKVKAQNTRKMEHLSGKDFTEVPVNITILDINNHIPEFGVQSVQLTVLEDKMRDLIYLLEAKDKDFDPKYNKISYEIQGSKSAFYILKNTNELYLENGKVDQVLGRTVSVIVEAFDTNRIAKRNSITITITFKDINNNLPLFGQTHYQKDILENTTVGSPIFKMKVSDDDVSEENKKTEFSIVNWSQKIPFFINANTGVITPWRTLDADGTESTTFSFQVRAQNTRKMEHLSGKNFTEVPVNITILDINNHIPEFGVQSVQLTVLEDKMRDLIYLLEAKDKDFDPKYNKISYEIQASKSAFFILKNTNELYLKNGQVDQVLGQTVSVIVEAFDTNRPAKRNSIKITITFKDINNNLPLFDQTQYQKDIFENSTVVSPIFTMKVSDDDVSEENKKTEFSIVNWNQKIPFFINANTGVITPWRTLDADGTESTTFSFKVRAQNTRKMEHLNGKNFTEVPVKIKVMNVNDNSPIFTRNVYLFQIKETAQQGQTLFHISASDRDNDMITYSLFGNHLPFKIGPSTGIISLSGNLDHEKKSKYDFSIRAIDGGIPQRSATANVFILVENVNKSPIVNDRMTFFILEEQPKGTPVGCIQASDPDGDQLDYSLIHSTDSKDFSIDPSSGGLKSKTVFNYEDKIQYNIIVQVSDALHKKNIAVTINVVNIKDHEPIFSKDNYKVNLTDFKKGALVIQLLAEDEDKKNTNDTIDYSLLGDSDFRILLNGEIRLTRNLDWKTKENSITLMASAIDSTNSSTSALVSIQIEKPLEFAKNNFSASISEAAPVGSTVFQFEPCNFVDRTVNISNLSVDLSNTILFVYNKECGCILTKAALDREIVETHVITMKLKDQKRTFQAKLIINIEDVNDEPPILDPVKNAILLSDDTEPGFVIIQMNATDKDINNGFTFYLKETYGKFLIDANSGVIRSCGKFNYHLKPEYDLTIVVIDHGSPPLESNQTLTIKITNGNRYTPVFEKSLFKSTVNESTPAGHLIVQLSANDKDHGENGHMSFHIISGNIDYAFAISESNGTVWVNNSKTLDYETTKMFNLTVEVSDNGINPNSSTAILLVNLEDINDNSPEFKSPNHFSMNLPIQKDELLFTLHAVDADSNKNGYNKLEYSQLNFKKAFDTNPLTGEVRSKSKLSKMKMYTVDFQVCDKGGKCASQSVELSTYSDVVRVDEGVSNAFVIDINATDGDSGVFYTLTSCNDYFTINSSTGIIRTQKSLVWQPQNNKIPITIMVHNSGKKSNYTDIHITVEVVDVNDHIPLFAQKTYTFQIDENSEKIVNIQATDMDDKENALITYSFSPSDPQVAKGSILLNPVTGTLNISSLDRETKDLYAFNIMAKDKGTPAKSSTTKVTIQVLDINDNKPIFTQDEYNATIDENSEPQKIVTVHANDADADLNGFVHYELQNKAVPFTINQITGDIWSMEGLDFEKNSMYKFQVLAIDRGMNPKSSLCSVNIRVLDVCDEVPQLTTIISLPKDKISGTLVFSLKSSENVTNYNISTEHNILAINNKTGNVFTNSEIPKTATTNYQTTVTAWGHCDLPVLTKFEIKPEDPLPKTSFEKLKAEVTENSCNGESIFNLSSIQRFQGKDVSFALKSYTSYFKIENEQIYCQKEMDHEKHSQVVLLIDVTFKKRPITYTADERLKIVVTVNDVNDNPPQFQHGSLFYSIPSTARFFYQVKKIKVIDDDVGENATSQFSLSGGDKDLFYINPSTGELHTLFDASQSKQSVFNLEVKAVDQNGKGLPTKAPLKVSIHDNKFNLEMNVDKPVDFVEKILDPFIGNLSEIIGFEIVVDQVQVHQNSDQSHDLQRSDILFHALDLKNKKLVSKELVDRKLKDYEKIIKDLLSQFGMQIGQITHISTKPVKTTKNTSNSEVIIIVLACLIFIGCNLGIIMTIVMTRRQQKKLRELKASKSASQNEFLEMSDTVLDHSKYSSREISMKSDDAASMNRQNGDIPHQRTAEDNLAFEGEPSHPKDLNESDAKDGYPSVSRARHANFKNNLTTFSSSKNDKETSETGSIANENSEVLVPASPPATDSQIIEVDLSADTNSASDSPIVPGSVGASENQNRDLDTGDITVQMDTGALESEKPTEDGDHLILYNLHDDEESITEL